MPVPVVVTVDSTFVPIHRLDQVVYQGEIAGYEAVYYHSTKFVIWYYWVYGTHPVIHYYVNHVCLNVLFMFYKVIS